MVTIRYYDISQMLMRVCNAPRAVTSIRADLIVTNTVRRLKNDVSGYTERQRQILSSACHFGSSEYGFMNDALGSWAQRKADHSLPSHSEEIIVDQETGDTCRIETRSFDRTFLFLQEILPMERWYVDRLMLGFRVLHMVKRSTQMWPTRWPSWLAASWDRQSVGDTGRNHSKIIDSSPILHLMILRAFLLQDQIRDPIGLPMAMYSLLVGSENKSEQFIEDRDITLITDAYALMIDGILDEKGLPFDDVMFLVDMKSISMGTRDRGQFTGAMIDASIARETKWRRFKDYACIPLFQDLDDVDEWFALKEYRESATVVSAWFQSNSILQVGPGYERLVSSGVLGMFEALEWGSQITDVELARPWIDAEAELPVAVEWIRRGITDPAQVDELQVVDEWLSSWDERS